MEATHVDWVKAHCRSSNERLNEGATVVVLVAYAELEFVSKCYLLEKKRYSYDMSAWEVRKS